MKITYLDGKRLYYAFLAGTKEVIANKKELNRINLFPVADGDNGSNLSNTLNVVKNEAVKDNSLAITLDSMGEAALKGAIGNSGIVFAQFINGFKNGICQEDTINLNKFAQGVEKAVNYTYQGINNPVEGTILTVMKDWLEELNNFKIEITELREKISELGDSLIAGRSFAETVEYLKSIRENLYIYISVSDFKKIKSILKVHQNKNGIKRFAVVHGDDIKRAGRYKESFSELLSIEADF